MLLSGYTLIFLFQGLKNWSADLKCIWWGFSWNAGLCLPHCNRALRWAGTVPATGTVEATSTDLTNMKLLFYSRVILKGNWKMCSTRLFFCLFKEMICIVLWDKYSQESWEMTAPWECVCSWRLSEPALCQRSWSSLCQSPQLSFKKFYVCSE